EIRTKLTKPTLNRLMQEDGFSQWASLQEVFEAHMTEYFLYELIRMFVDSTAKLSEESLSLYRNSAGGELIKDSLMEQMHSIAATFPKNPYLLVLLFKGTRDSRIGPKVPNKNEL